MKWLHRTLAVAALTTALPLAAGTLQVVTPTRGATLRGGASASLQWRADQLPRGAEEWEAFLSVDGGRFYAFRITPHLDIGLRGVTFVVPNVDTRDARILIRTGDEEVETTFEMRDSFAIVRDPHAEQLASRTPGFRHAESARVGDPEVIAWADGGRNGAGVTQQSAIPAPSTSIGLLPPISNDPSSILPPEEIWAPASQAATLRPSAVEKQLSRAERQTATTDILLACMRRNI